jgi:hypothetical protein
MESRVLVIGGCFAALELLALDRMVVSGRNPDVAFFDDLATPKQFMTEADPKKGPKGPRNRWGQMK